MASLEMRENRPLDKPQTSDFDVLAPDFYYLLANHEVRVLADRQSDLADLEWPWVGAHYARTIRTRLTTMQGEELIPIANRYYPGYQETIYGSEGLILSKRLVAPLHSADDRALFWSYECQAEGDSVVRFEVDIEWGEPLTQRMVDGLLVAQANPRAEKGIYKQSNADSTRVFGNPHGRPDSVELDDSAGTAKLVYHVLVNGIVDVSLLLTISDVGEQVAWSSFLALRDTEQVLDHTNRAWDDALKTARLWTPDVRTNHAVQLAKRDALLHLVHLRSGMVPYSRAVEFTVPLLNVLDAIDPAQSRNLLEHLRRLAVRSKGRMPVEFPLRPKDPLEPPGKQIQMTNSVYIAVLAYHTMHHPDEAFLAAHMEPSMLCIRKLEDRNLELMTPSPSGAVRLRTPPDGPWHYADPWAGMVYAAQAIWENCGVSCDGAEVVVAPKWPTGPRLPALLKTSNIWGWKWWALLDLPIMYTSTPPSEPRLSLVWDGKTLHTNMPVRSRLPVVVHDSIRALHTDEMDFDLTFEFADGDGASRTSTLFRPMQWVDR